MFPNLNESTVCGMKKKYESLNLKKRKLDFEGDITELHPKKCPLRFTKFILFRSDLAQVLEMSIEPPFSANRVLSFPIIIPFAAAITICDLITAFSAWTCINGEKI
jgi:hypothetical protein